MTENVIIVGAPRSGTNILRDVLTSLPGFATWPCDEINLYWKHHNREFASDELQPAHARPEVRRYMHQQFDKIARKFNAHTVVEKTCATSLRVLFTAELFPEAKYIFIRRDGLDAAASTMKRWDAPFDLEYVAKKLRYAPLSDLPFYGKQFISKRAASLRANRINSAASDASRKVESWWGPKPNDFQYLQQNHPLDELAFVQWQRCVESSKSDLAKLPQNQVHEIAYEDFVTSPEAELGNILAFLGRAPSMSSSAVSGVSSASVGKGRTALGPDSVRRLTELGESTLEKFGYA